MIASETRTVCSAGEKSVTFTITDHVRNQMLLMPLRTPGANKVDAQGVRTEAMSGPHSRGVMRYDPGHHRGKIELLVGERYLVGIEGAGVDLDELKLYAKGLDDQGLAAHLPRPEEMLDVKAPATQAAKP
jgi:hypothetical protein